MEIVKIVDEVLESLGYNVREVIYWYMEGTFSLKRKDIEREPEKFVEVLKSIYGEGAQVLEEMLVRSLCKEFKIDAKTFPEAVRKAKLALRRL